MHAGRRALDLLAELALAGAVGLVVLWLVGVLVPPAQVPFPGHGEAFAAMAARPLSLDGEFPQRLLWPLLAWLAAGLGAGPAAFSQLCSAFLIAVVFWFARRRIAAAGDALLVAASVAVSGAVLVYQPMACFSDPLSLASLVLLVHFAPRPRVFWPLVFVSALAHELVFFFAPWLVYLRRAHGGSLLRELGWLGGALGCYLLVRLPMQARYGALYYLDANFWVPWGLPAMWALWAFVALIEFGPLLAVVVRAWRTGELARPQALGGRWGPWLYLLALLPLMVLAYDVMRFAAFLHLPLVFSALALLGRPRGRALLGGLLALQCATYLWLHPEPTEQGGRPFWIVTGHVNELLGLLVERTPGGALSFTWQLLLRAWPLALAGAAAAAAVFSLGLWLARPRPAPRG